MHCSDESFIEVSPARRRVISTPSTTTSHRVIFPRLPLLRQQHIPVPTTKQKMAANGLGFVYRTAVPAAIGFGILQSSIYDVKGGSRAVIFDRVSGVKEQVVNEGTHFLVPWLQRAIVFDVRTKPRNIATTTGSKDLQMVSLTLRVLHRPDVKALPKIYQVCLLPLPLHPDRQGANTRVEPRPRLRRACAPLHR